MVDKIELPPGKYVLTETVKNPKPDRRQKHDWRHAVEWPEGSLFYIQEHGVDYDISAGYGQTSYFTISKCGESSYHDLPLRKPSELDDFECFKALKLTEKLRPVEEITLGDVLSGPDGVGKHLAPELIAVMLDQDSIRIENVQAASEKLNSMNEKDFSALSKEHQI